MNSPLEIIIEQLPDGRWTPSGQWNTYCPAHGDQRSRHLYIAEGEDKRLLIKCHKGCAAKDIMEAVGLTEADMFVPRSKVESNPPLGVITNYQIRDLSGEHVATHKRKDYPDGSKRVWWTTTKGEPGLGGRKTDDLPLYGCHRAQDKARVIIVEGEKAAEALQRLGLPAVGTVTGAASTPSLSNLQWLEGKTVILWADADDDGEKHMRRVGKLLEDVAATVQWFEWAEAPDKGDAADHPDVQGGKSTIKSLIKALKDAPPFRPPHNRETDGAATMGVYIPESRKLRRLRREHGGITGIKTGLPRVDAGLHGFNRGCSYIFAARPSVGKSVVIGQFAYVAAQQHKRVLLQSAEMSAAQYLQRMAYYLADVDYFAGMDGRTTEEEEERVDMAEELIARLPLQVDDWGGQTVDRIRHNVETHEPDILFVDYLQYLIPEDVRANRNTQVGQLSRDLSRIKSDYDIPVVVAAQLNRSPEGRPDKTPMMGDLRDSGEIEQDADAVILLHRPYMHSKEHDDDVMEMSCQKFRMGVTWKATFYFLEDQMIITDETGVRV